MRTPAENEEGGGCESRGLGEWQRLGATAVGRNFRASLAAGIQLMSSEDRRLLTVQRVPRAYASKNTGACSQVLF